MIGIKAKPVSQKTGISDVSAPLFQPLRTNIKSTNDTVPEEPRASAETSVQPQILIDRTDTHAESMNSEDARAALFGGGFTDSHVHPSAVQ